MGIVDLMFSLSLTDNVSSTLIFTGLSGRLEAVNMLWTCCQPFLRPRIVELAYIIEESEAAIAFSTDEPADDT